MLSLKDGQIINMAERATNAYEVTLARISSN